MSPKVIQVEPLDHYKLRLFFDNNEVRIFDVTPYLDKGVFTELKSVHYFQSVKPIFGGIQWPNEQDLSPDTLYLLSQLERSQSSIVSFFRHCHQSKVSLSDAIVSRSNMPMLLAIG